MTATSDTRAGSRREELLRITLESEHHAALTRRSRRPRPHPLRITGRDLELLAFVAAHRFVEAGHVVEWTGADRSIAYRRLARFEANGLLRYERIFHAQPGCFRITHGGLAVIDSSLPKAKIDLRTYRHDRLVVWLWLAAHAGEYGSCSRLVTEREIRHYDQAPDSDHDSYGIRLSGFDRGGKPRRHYPDVLVIAPNGQRIALELELSMKGQRRLEEILLAYALDDELVDTIYVTDQPLVQRKLEELIDRFGIDQRVRCVYSPGLEKFTGGRRS